MTELPSETALGYRVPAVQQFSIFLENRVGRLLEVVRSFDEAVNVDELKTSRITLEGGTASHELGAAKAAYGAGPPLLNLY